MRPQDDTEIKDDNTEKDTRQTEDDTVSLRTIIRERALEDDVTPTKNTPSNRASRAANAR